jgi:hypothetical protein
MKTMAKPVPKNKGGNQNIPINNNNNNNNNLNALNRPMEKRPYTEVKEVAVLLKSRITQAFAEKPGQFQPA